MTDSSAYYDVISKYYGVSSLKSKFDHVFNIFSAKQKRNVFATALLNCNIFTRYCKNRSYKIKILLQTHDFKTVFKSLVIRNTGKRGSLCMKCQQNSYCWG